MRTPLSVPFLIVALAALAHAEPSRLELRGPGPVPGEPIAIVVHGINPTPGEMEPLAADLIERGFRVFLFTYDSHRRLDGPAADLGHLVGGLLERVPTTRVAVVAHSMGGLVARRALTEGHVARLAGRREQFRLLTIASPFAGFVSANFSRLDFGLGPDVFHDLGSSSRFVRRPGHLGANVRHDKLETDERDQRRPLHGVLVDDDRVPLKSQRRSEVDLAATTVEVAAVGHVESIDAEGELPFDTDVWLTAHLGPRRGGGTSTPRRVEVFAPGGVRGAGRSSALEEGVTATRLTFATPRAAAAYAAFVRERGAGVPRRVVVRGRDALLLEAEDEVALARLASAWRVDEAPTPTEHAGAELGAAGALTGAGARAEQQLAPAQ